jgi:hypothetical protein
MKECGIIINEELLKWWLILLKLNSPKEKKAGD